MLRYRRSNSNHGKFETRPIAKHIQAATSQSSKDGGAIMKRYAQTVMLKDDPEAIQQYEEYHANPWP